MYDATFYRHCDTVIKVHVTASGEESEPQFTGVLKALKHLLVNDPPLYLMCHQTEWMGPYVRHEYTIVDEGNPAPLIWAGVTMLRPPSSRACRPLFDGKRVILVSPLYF